MNSNFSIVIVNYNGFDFIAKTLKNLEISNLKPNKIIVVDDGSFDKSVNLIKKNFPEITLVINKKNSGTAAARNRGAELAKGEYIIFIDNDVFIERDTFYQLIRFAKKDNSRAAVGAKIVLQNNERMWWNMGYDPNDFREIVGYCFGFLIRFFNSADWLEKISTKFILNYWDYNEPLMVDWVVETCFLVRKDVFNKVGGFDENFFMFFEGPDLCKRIRVSGFKVFFNPCAKVKVLEKHTHSDLERKKFHWLSKKYFYKKHYIFFRRITLFLGNLLNGIFYSIA